MQVDYSFACKVYNNFPNSIKTPQHNPNYVLLDAIRDASIEPIFFVYEKNGETFYSAVHKSVVAGTNLFDLQSPYGYGGPIATTDNKQFLHKAWDAYTEWCMDNNVLVEFIRFHPLIQNWKYYHGKVLENRETIWIDLTQDDLMSSYRPRVRTSIRKAINSGLRVDWFDGEQFIDLFVPLYYQQMQNLGAESFYFFPHEYFEAMARWNSARFAVCSLEQKTLAASIFLFDAGVMEYHLSASYPEGKRLCATNLLVHEAANFGKSLGCTVLHLGGGTDAQDDNKLLFFKSGFSRNRSLYKIGMKIYLEKEYERLKIAWGKNNIKGNKILFYR